MWREWSLKFLNKEGFYVVEFCCAGVVWNHPGPGSIYLYCSMKSSRFVRKPGSAYGINFGLISHCFERRNHDALLAGVSADSKCDINTIRRTKRLQFHWKTVTAKAEYGRQLRGYRLCNAL